MKKGSKKVLRSCKKIWEIVKMLYETWKKVKMSFKRKLLESCKNFDIILLLKLCMSCLLKLKSRTDRQTNIALFWDCIAPKKFKMGQGKKTKCFETLAQSSFANTFPLGLVGELLETKTKIRPNMLQTWDFSCRPFF